MQSSGTSPKARIVQSYVANWVGPPSYPDLDEHLLSHVQWASKTTRECADMIEAVVFGVTNPVMLQLLAVALRAIDVATERGFALLQLKILSLVSGRLPDGSAAATSPS